MGLSIKTMINKNTENRREPPSDSSDEDDRMPGGSRRQFKMNVAIQTAKELKKQKAEELALQMARARNEASQTDRESHEESFNKGLEHWLKKQIAARKTSPDPPKAHIKYFKEVEV